MANKKMNLPRLIRDEKSNNLFNIEDTTSNEYHNEYQKYIRKAERLGLSFPVRPSEIDKKFEDALRKEAQRLTRRRGLAFPTIIFLAYSFFLAIEPYVGGVVMLG